MTNIATLLTRKQELLSRLEECPGPNERGEIERLLEKIDAELTQWTVQIGCDLPGELYSQDEKQQSIETAGVFHIVLIAAARLALAVSIHMHGRSGCKPRGR
jgi:hypothetical protein